MRRIWLGRAALAIAGVLLLLITAAVILVMGFDAESYKAQAIDWMKSERQRTLVIDGPVELSVFPQLAVRISGVRLSERGSDAPFATITDASLAVQAMPLLGKRVVIDSVSASGVHLHYKRDVNGVRNFDDLLGGPGESASASEDSASTGEPMSLAVSSISLDDLRLRLDDDKAGMAADIVLQTFKSGRLANQTETPISFKSTLSMSKPQAMQLMLQGSARFKPDMETAGAALRELRLAVAGEAAGVKQLAMELEGALAWADGGLRSTPTSLPAAPCPAATSSRARRHLQASSRRRRRAALSMRFDCRALTSGSKEARASARWMARPRPMRC